MWTERQNESSEWVDLYRDIAMVGETIASMSDSDQSSVITVVDENISNQNWSFSDPTKWAFA